MCRYFAIESRRLKLVSRAFSAAEERRFGALRVDNQAGLLRVQIDIFNKSLIPENLARRSLACVSRVLEIF